MRAWGMGLTVVLAGCGSPPAPPPAVPEPVATPAPGPVAEPQPTPAEPSNRMTTEDGWVAITIPDGWTCEENHAGAHGVTATWIRCDRDERTYLLAKDYQVPEAQVLPAQRLFEEHYENNYRRMFQRFDYRSKGAVPAAGLDAWEVALEGPRGDLGAIHLRERAIVAGTHIALLTAHVPADEREALDEMIEAWFTQTAFQSVSRQSSMRTAEIVRGGGMVAVTDPGQGRGYGAPPGVRQPADARHRGVHRVGL